MNFAVDSSFPHHLQLGIVAAYSVQCAGLLLGSKVAVAPFLGLRLVLICY